MSGLGLAGAGANVIMQLSRMPVGYGVVESVVESGSLYRHPVKRTRTTLTYIVLALHGTELERTALRRAVNEQHRQVRSTPQSPVSYNAFDPELQLWVAACMWRGLLDAANVLYPNVDAPTLDALYAHSSRFATTLQVPAAKWPSNRADFDVYWESSLRLIAVDEVTREYLNGIASLRFAPQPFRFALGGAHRFITTGFLDEPFRRELGLPWTSRQRTVFRVLTAILARTNQALPPLIREVPWNIILWDARRRIRMGRPLV